MATLTKTRIAHGTSERLENIVRHYRIHVLGDSPTVDYSFQHQVPDSDAIRSLARWFEGADRRPSEVDRRKVVDAYGEFTEQLGQQFRLLRAFGYKAEVVDRDPFDSAEGMVTHVRNHQHLPVMSTGTGDFPADHPLTNPSRFTDANGRRMLHNDIFRWIHDILGHVHLGSENAPFTLKGEWRTWNAHAQMFTGDDALSILATEAIAQIAWMHSAPRFDGDERPIDQREFAEQKIARTPKVLREAVAA
ncbi:hypothetical protein [Salinibacter ruber]|uniref:Uncharacterized protein n=1 Tax=Salinibacter ruber TaxID=146919 RepID=A0A9X2TKE8_9BACT|nr:hypothetical protein [Salinibacter ruber]MCS3661770.1 hypothetical protein [Salinibacter ruber]MCS3711569.1 hypothetical protein [Salinibacter ruber]